MNTQAAVTPSDFIRRIKVLAVDDKPANLLALEAVLGGECDVLPVTSGEEALALLRERCDVDIILMDVQMPVMDGFETSRRIKEIESARDIPIIFITAVYTEDPSVRQGYAAGGIDYFTKPFDPEILKLKVGIYAAFKHRSDLLRERDRQIRESRELLAAGRKLSSILEGLPVGVIIADVQGRICQVNDAVSRILRSHETIESDSYGAVLGWWDGEGRVIKDPKGALARALRDGQATRNELMPIRCFDGTERMLLCSASPLRQVDGRTVGAVIVLQDVTEPRRIEEDLQQRITRLVALGVELERSFAG